MQLRKVESVPVEKLSTCLMCREMPRRLQSLDYNPCVSERGLGNIVCSLYMQYGQSLDRPIQGGAKSAIRRVLVDEKRLGTLYTNRLS